MCVMKLTSVRTTSESPAYGCSAVGHIAGQVIFVPGGISGDDVPEVWNRKKTIPDTVLQVTTVF